MATQLETEQDPGLASLLRGIIEDAQRLLIDQLTLFQVEIKNDIRRAATAIAMLMIGAGFFFVALLLLGIGAPYLLVELYPQLPLWGGYAIVGGATLLLAIGLLIAGKVVLGDFRPTDTALKGLKENLQWKTKK